MCIINEFVRFYSNEFVSNFIFFISAVASIVKGVLGFIDSLAYNEISKYLERATPLGAGDWFFYFDFISFTITFILFLPLLWKMKDPTTIKNIFTVATMSLLLSIILAGSVKGIVNFANVRNFSQRDTFN